MQLWSDNAGELRKRALTPSYMRLIFGLDEDKGHALVFSQYLTKHSREKRRGRLGVEQRLSCRLDVISCM